MKQKNNKIKVLIDECTIEATPREYKINIIFSTTNKKDINLIYSMLPERFTKFKKPKYLIIDIVE